MISWVALEIKKTANLVILTLVLPHSTALEISEFHVF